MLSIFVFFNDTATTEIYTLSLHDALPISGICRRRSSRQAIRSLPPFLPSFPVNKTLLSITSIAKAVLLDRKSTRLNSSHANISYAVFCLKKKKLAQVIVTSEALVLHNMQL